MLPISYAFRKFTMNIVCSEKKVFQIQQLLDYNFWKQNFTNAGNISKVCEIITAISCVRLQFLKTNSHKFPKFGNRRPASSKSRALHQPLKIKSLKYTHMNFAEIWKTAFASSSTVTSGNILAISARFSEVFAEGCFITFAPKI